MVVDANTVMAAVALFGALGTIVYAVRKYGAVEIAAAKVVDIEKRLSAVETDVALLKRDHANHNANDERAFSELRSAIDSLRVAVDEMRHDLLDVLVALKVKDRPR